MFTNIAFGPVDLVLQESATQQAPLGQRLMLEDGREFRYAKMGASAVTKGKVCQAAVQGADHIKDLAVPTAVAAGASAVVLTNGGTTAVTVDMFKDGYVYFNDCGAGTGEGQIHRIKSNSAAATGAALTITFYDGETLTTALTTAAEAGIIKNPYGDVVVAATTYTAPVVGVTVRDMTAAYYGWLQTKGIAAVLTNGTVVLGAQVVPGATTAGSVDVMPQNSVDAAVKVPSLGIVAGVAASTEYSCVLLSIQGA
jgi:hypothetical protein